MRKSWFSAIFFRESEREFEDISPALVVRTLLQGERCVCGDCTMPSFVCLAFLFAVVVVGPHQSTAMSLGEHPTLPTNLPQLSNGDLSRLLQDSDFTECVKVSFALQSKNSGKFLRVAKKGTVLDARGRSWRPKRGTVCVELTQKFDVHVPTPITIEGIGSSRRLLPIELCSRAGQLSGEH